MRRKRISLPSRLDESSSPEFECSVGHPPASSSRLRVNFRDMSPETSETNHTHDRASEYWASREGYQDRSLQVIKTLKSWGIRFPGEGKDSPEPFLSILKGCKRATGMPDKDQLPCLASVLVKEAGDWYEVYQEEM